MTPAKSFTPDRDTLYFIPLGGAGEFGVHFNLYCLNDNWLIADCGIGFADESLPLVDIVLPDPKFIEAQKDKIVGMVITHAHEDHIGAVPYLWDRLGKPVVYCSRFAAEFLKAKNSEMNIFNMRINVIEAEKSYDISPFAIECVHVAHSIPESMAIAIKTPQGTVVHSGDFHLDPEPPYGPVTDSDRLKALGDKGVLAYMGDSTNCLESYHRYSEKEVEEGLEKLFREVKGKIVVTIIASHISRIRSIAVAAAAVGRRCAIMGRSMHRMVSAALNCGYLRDIDPLLPVEEAQSLPSDRVVFIVTGAQGQDNAALARIARGEKRGLKLGKDDAVLFSARVIPGNETEVNTVINYFTSGKTRVFQAKTAPYLIHASSHPYRDEVRQMLTWMRPQIVVPVHGERAQLEAQAELARELNVPHVIVPQNGSVIKLAPGTPEIVAHVETGTLAVEPSRVVSTNHKGLQQRRKLQFTGAMHISLALDHRGKLAADPHVSSLGIIDPEAQGEDSFDADMAMEVEDILANMNAKDLQNPTAVAEILTSALRSTVYKSFGFKPKITVHVMYMKG